MIFFKHCQSQRRNKYRMPRAMNYEDNCEIIVWPGGNTDVQTAATQGLIWNWEFQTAGNYAANFMGFARVMISLKLKIKSMFPIHLPSGSESNYNCNPSENLNYESPNHQESSVHMYVILLMFWNPHKMVILNQQDKRPRLMNNEAII